MLTSARQRLGLVRRKLSLARTGGRAMRDLLFVRLERRRQPVVVSWAITHRCNLRCVYCDVPDRPLEELTTDQALAIAGDMAAAGTRVVAINGGEPLLRRDIETIVRRLRSHGIAVSINTNGTYLPKRAGVLDHLHKLQLSVDGAREVHEAQRGPGTWGHVTAAAELARSRGVPLGLSVVLTKHNLDQVDPLIAAARDWNATINFLPVGPVHAYDLDYQSLCPEPEAMRATYRYIADLALRGAPVLGSPSSFAYLMRWPDAPKIPCLGANGIAKLAADGRLYPFWNLEWLTSAINAVEHGFRAAFDHLEDDPLACSGCHCTKTLQLNQVFFDTFAAVPFSYRALLGRMLAPPTGRPGAAERPEGAIPRRWKEGPSEAGPGRGRSRLTVLEDALPDEAAPTCPSP